MTNGNYVKIKQDIQSIVIRHNADHPHQLFIDMISLLMSFYYYFIPLKSNDIEMSVKNY